MKFLAFLSGTRSIRKAEIISSSNSRVDLDTTTALKLILAKKFYINYAVKKRKENILWLVTRLLVPSDISHLEQAFLLLNKPHGQQNETSISHLLECLQIVEHLSYDGSNATNITLYQLGNQITQKGKLQPNSLCIPRKYHYGSAH